MFIPNVFILVGHSAKEFTPTYRGFDSHFGYWLGKQDYYSHISVDGKDSDVSGYFLLELKFCRIIIMVFFHALQFLQHDIQWHYYLSCLQLACNNFLKRKTYPTTSSLMFYREMAAGAMISGITQKFIVLHLANTSKWYDVFWCLFSFRKQAFIRFSLI